MTDIIERAEAVLAGRHVGGRMSSIARIYGSVITDLVAELKAAREENERLKDFEWMYQELQ